MNQQAVISLNLSHRVINQTFGKLVVQNPTQERTSRGEVLYNCLCFCGNYKLTTKRLLDNRVKSCGCLRKERGTAMCKARFNDLSGQVFERLRVICRSGSTALNQPLYLCWCICGQISIVQAGNLRSGTTRSCGCLAKEIHSKVYKEICKKKHQGNRKKKCNTLAHSRSPTAASSAAGLKL
jgi:hypothetical protein